MNGKRFKNEVVKWAKHVGRREAVKRLITAGERGMSPSMAERLVKGTYQSEPHADTMDDIRIEMAKDGFSFGDEKAS